MIYRLPRVTAPVGPSIDSSSAWGRCTPCPGRKRTASTVFRPSTWSYLFCTNVLTPHIYCKPTQIPPNLRQMERNLLISKTKRLRGKVQQCPSRILFFIQMETLFGNPPRETVKIIKSWYTCSSLNRADVYVVSPKSGTVLSGGLGA